MLDDLQEIDVFDLGENAQQEIDPLFTRDVPPSWLWIDGRYLWIYRKEGDDISHMIEKLPPCSLSDDTYLTPSYSAGYIVNSFYVKI